MVTTTNEINRSELKAVKILLGKEGSEFGYLGENGGDVIPLTAFGEVSSVYNYPNIQSAPVNNFLPANFRAYTSGSGTAGVTDREFTCTTGETALGYGAVQSFRCLSYRAGQGAL